MKGITHFGGEQGGTVRGISQEVEFVYRLRYHLTDNFHQFGFGHHRSSPPAAIICSKALSI